MKASTVAFILAGAFAFLTAIFVSVGQLPQPEPEVTMPYRFETTPAVHVGRLGDGCALCLGGVCEIYWEQNLDGYCDLSDLPPGQYLEGLIRIGHGESND